MPRSRSPAASCVPGPLRKRRELANLAFENPGVKLAFLADGVWASCLECFLMYSAAQAPLSYE